MFERIRKRLRRTRFNKIKVGEVFATLGCTNYFVKTGANKATLVDTDISLFKCYLGDSISYTHSNLVNLYIYTSAFDLDSKGYVYKVPRDVQERYVA